jgi:RNase P subunit RPR2
MTKIDFSQINKNAAKSFNEQRNLIKLLAKGKTVLCEQCQQPLTLTVKSEVESGVQCNKGCTQINLELDI